MGMFLGLQNYQLDLVVAKRKLEIEAQQQLVGKRIRVFLKNDSGPDLDRTICVGVVEFDLEFHGGADYPSFVLCEAGSDLKICIHKDTEITILD